MPFLKGWQCAIKEADGAPSELRKLFDVLNHGDTATRECLGVPWGPQELVKFAQKRDEFPESCWQRQDAEAAGLLTSNSCTLNCLPKCNNFFFYSERLKIGKKVKQTSACPVQSKWFPGPKAVVKPQLCSLQFFLWNKRKSELNKQQRGSFWICSHLKRLPCSFQLLHQQYIYLKHK